MRDDTERKWRRFQKVRISRKDVLKRMRKAETATTRHAHKFILKRWGNVREVRRIVALWVLAVGCLIAATGVQVLWSQNEYQTQAGAYGGVYAEAVLGPVNTLNPLFASSPAEDAASYLLFSRLLSYDTSGNLNYDLADGIEASDDGMTYRVSLRRGVHWHDGRALTARDVVFTAELLKDPATRSQIRGWSDMEVRQVDDQTVEFVLPAPYAAFEHALTFPILPEHILGNIPRNTLREHDFSQNPVGSGPFSLRIVQAEDVAGDRRIIHTVANEQYYKGAAKLSRFQLHVYPDKDSMIQALSVNEVNAASGLSLPDVQMIDSNRYKKVARPIQNGVYALLNTESEVLGDRAVRRALQRATDTDQVRQKVGGDVPSLDLPFTNSQVPGEMPVRPSYNVEAARKILDDAGWRVQDGIRKKGDRELRLSVVTTKDAEYERALETLIGQWRQLDIAIDERIVDASDPSQSFAQTVLQPRNYDVLVYQLAIGRDPDVYAYWHSSQATARGLNLSNYSSVVADDILATARTTLDGDLRNAKYVSFAERWIQDVPAIGLYQSTMQYVYSENVYNGIDRVNPVSSRDRYSNVIYWTAGDRPVYKTP